jgi:hypothetical protein
MTRPGAVQELHRLAEAPGQVGLLLEPDEFVGRKREGHVPGRFVVGVDLVATEVRGQAGEVLRGQTLEDLELTGEALDAVGQPVGQRGLALPAARWRGAAPGL